MRWVTVVLVLTVTAGFPGLAVAAAEPGAGLALTGVYHALEGRHLVISGWVENRGPSPVGRLVVDASGMAPSGETTAFGSDGIPWQIAPGASETFSLRLPVDDRLIRAYTVHVASASAPARPFASVRQTVSADLYRPLLLQMVRAQGDLIAGRLTLRADAQRLPVSTVTVEVRVIVIQSIGRRPFEDRRIETLLVDVPAEGTVSIHLGTSNAVLLALRVTDVRLRIAW
jgi:hypothetical protein